MPNYSKKIVYLTQAQYQELITNETITVDGVTVNYNENDIYVTPQAEPITDVNINGISIESNGIANIPLGSTSNFGVFKISTDYGINATNGYLHLRPATDEHMKGGTVNHFPITPGRQHMATFYGLSKVAGVDLASVTCTLGIYPDASKAAIQSMLGITDLIASSEASTATAAHVANSLFMMDGKLVRATTAVAIGDAVEVGTNCEVVSVSEAFATNTNLDLKADKTDTVLLTTLSRGRKASTTVGENSFAFGYDVTASAKNSFATGNNTVASGLGAIATGALTTASAKYSHTEGSTTTSSGFYSHAEGEGTTAAGKGSHSEGFCTLAANSYAHAEGMYTIANSSFSHVAGKYNVADSHDNWPEWTANTQYSVGDKVKVTTTTNNETTVNGYICKTSNSDASFTSSNWNQDFYMNYAEIIGNGTADDARSNARTLDWEGNERLNGYLYVGCNADSTSGTRMPHDVQINGNSIVSNGIANISTTTSPVSSDTALITSGGVVSALNVAFGTTDAQIKGGTQTFRAITPVNQHKSVFYGLAKVAGYDLASVTCTVGTYPTAAQTAIQTMLGVEKGVDLVETITGTTPSITAAPNVRYVCGEVSTISITPPAGGTCDVIFESGSTASVLTVPNTVKWPAWFDATTLETDTIYEIMITDATYGSVMTWAAS